MILPESFNEPSALHLDFFDTFRPVLNMLHRALLCLTAFFASFTLFSGQTHSGPYAQAQYLLGLGKVPPYCSGDHYTDTAHPGIGDITG